MLSVQIRPGLLNYSGGSMIDTKKYKVYSIDGEPCLSLTSFADAVGMNKTTIRKLTQSTIDPIRIITLSKISRSYIPISEAYKLIDSNTKSDTKSELIRIDDMSERQYVYHIGLRITP